MSTSSFSLINNEGSEQVLRPFDESWSLYQVLLADEINLISNVDDQQSQLVVENGLESMKIDVKSRKKMIVDRKMMDDEINGDEEVNAKKLDHNAKERIRRMKINTSFLALRALLPDSSRSKVSKRWGAPALVDRVVKYIPEMENEVQALTFKKQTLPLSKDENIPTFLFNLINQREAVIQMCIGRQDYEDGLALMKLMQKVEDEGISINSVSALHISDNAIVCCHLHIQISDATYGVDQLRDKIISWLR